MGDDGTFAWVEQNVVGLRARAKRGETSASFLEFVNIFNPDESVVGESSEDLIGCLHF